MLESGEFFLSTEQKNARQAAAQEARQAARTEERQRQRDEAFQVPAEARGGGSAAGGAGQRPQQQQGQGQETSASLAETLKKKLKGGINFQAMVPQSSLDSEAVAAILKEYKIHNADVLVHDDSTVDDFIDVV